MSAVPHEMRATAAVSLASRWRHRADRMAELLDEARSNDIAARATVETLRLCANELEPMPRPPAQREAS